MAGIGWKIRVHDEELKEFFIYAGYKARDLRHPFRRVAMEVILPGLFEQFDTEGGRTGGWIPLTPAYELQKEKDGFIGKPILERTGVGKTAAMNPAAFDIHMNSMTYHPITPEYMEFHQEGRGNVPVREWFVWTESDEAKTHRIFYDWLDDLRTHNVRRPGPLGYTGPLPQGFSFI